MNDYGLLDGASYELATAAGVVYIAVNDNKPMCFFFLGFIIFGLSR